MGTQEAENNGVEVEVKKAMDMADMGIMEAFPTVDMTDDMSIITQS